MSPQSQLGILQVLAVDADTGAALPVLLHHPPAQQEPSGTPALISSLPIFPLSAQAQGLSPWVGEGGSSRVPLIHGYPVFRSGAIKPLRAALRPLGRQSSESWNFFSQGRLHDYVRVCVLGFNPFSTFWPRASVGTNAFCFISHLAEFSSCFRCLGFLPRRVS